MSTLTKEDVIKLANLARLDIKEADIISYQRDLNQILDYVAVLNKVNTDELLPTYQVTNLTNVSRADEIKAYSYKAADLLLNVPAIKDQHIQVKRMI